MGVSIRAQEYAIKKTEKYIPESYGDMRHRRVAERFDSYDIEQAYQDGAQEALASQWVSVEDALPEDDEDVVLVYAYDPYSGSPYFDLATLDGEWYSISGMAIDVIKWMKIPPLNPEKE